MYLVVLIMEQSEQVIAIGIPLVVILGIFFRRKNLRDLHHAALGMSPFSNIYWSVLNSF